MLNRLPVLPPPLPPPPRDSLQMGSLCLYGCVMTPQVTVEGFSIICKRGFVLSRTVWGELNRKTLTMSLRRNTFNRSEWNRQEGPDLGPLPRFDSGPWRQNQAWPNLQTYGSVSTMKETLWPYNVIWYIIAAITKTRFGDAERIDVVKN